MPPLGAGVLDWFASHGLQEDQVPATPESLAEKNSDLTEEVSSFDQTQAQTALPESNIFASPSESPPSTNEDVRSEEHTSELQSPCNLVCRLLLEKKKDHITTEQSHQQHQ